MLKLFHNPGSCSLASYIALEEAGADYEVVRLNMREGEQTRPEYLAINPKGRIPALIKGQGVLTETPAILAYIAQAFPAARLAPIDDPWAFAQAQAFNSYLCSTVHVAYAHRLRGSRWADEESSFEDMRRKVPRTYAACFQLIEDGMLRGPWVLGDAYSICDAYLFTLAGWIEATGVDPKQFAKVHDHRERVRSRPAVRRVLARETS